MSDFIHSELLLKSLVDAPLLVEQLGDYPHLDRGFFELGELEDSLNFSQKLGHLYEDALEQILKSNSHVTDLHCGIQVFKNGGRTLGEFDYLFRFVGKIIHLELAVKFYCAVRIDGELRWYGPDARDHWDRKHKRMLSHQLEIAQTNEGRDTIEKLFGSSEVQTKHLIYGRLFDAVNSEQEAAIDVSESVARGKWLWRSELAEYVNSEKLWLIPKCLWPCKISTALLNALDLIAQKELLELTQERAVMFTDGKMIFFLVHDHWLENIEKVD